MIGLFFFPGLPVKENSRKARRGVAGLKLPGNKLGEHADKETEPDLEA
jgi:hypothetical protein